MRNSKGITVRVPRKQKKRIKAIMGPDEFKQQRALIRGGWADDFVIWFSVNRQFEDFIVPVTSGLICTVCGYPDSIKCFIDDPDEPEAEILCGEHAAEEGYCCCCGQFSAGMTSFDFTHPGYCDNCYDQVVADTGEDEDGDGWDLDYIPNFY